ncbi:MAG: phosphatidylinositol mannoside acyltransferase [Acidimicrobiales bacterium]
MAPDFVTAGYRAGAAVARGLPRGAADRVADALSDVAMLSSKERRLLVERHMRRALGPDASAADVRRAVRRSFASYGRYWVDSFRLPDMSVAEIDRGMTTIGLEHIKRAVASGTGPILVLPHLGGWEWAGFWLTLVPHFTVTVVVETVEPKALFDFFVDFRRQLGMHIVPLGPEAAPAVLRAIKEGHVLCLLSDRDIEGNGVEVDFFGERTTLPAGPATLALRTGAPLLPTACYFKESGGVLGFVRPPVPAERQAKRLRDDVGRITQDLAHELEGLIRKAPDQWHLQQPNWPSDWDALEAMGKPHPRPGEH